MALKRPLLNIQASLGVSKTTNGHKQAIVGYSGLGPSKGLFYNDLEQAIARYPSALDMSRKPFFNDVEQAIV